LLETAIGVTLQSAQQPGNIPIGARADAEEGFRRARQELVGRAVVERDALAGLQPPDKAKPSLKLPPGASFTERLADPLNWATPLADRLR
jgi:hypothetical protein